MTISFLATIAIIFFLCISRHTPCSSALILCYPGLRCDNVPSSHCVTLAEEKQSLHSTETGYPPAPFTLLQPSRSFSSSVTFCYTVLFPLSFPQFLLCLVLLFFSPVVFCLGMLATLQLYSSMHFISSFISDFVIIYSLIYLNLFMHAVCETDSCIYQWNRVRS